MRYDDYVRNNEWRHIGPILFTQAELEAQAKARGLTTSKEPACRRTPPYILIIYYTLYNLNFYNLNLYNFTIEMNINSKRSYGGPSGAEAWCWVSTSTRMGPRAQGSAWRCAMCVAGAEQVQDATREPAL